MNTSRERWSGSGQSSSSTGGWASVLHGMDHDRAAAPLDREDALDPQEVGAAQRGQHRHRLLDGRPRQRPIEDQRKAFEAVGVRVAMIMRLIVLVRIEALRRRRLVEDKRGGDRAMLGDADRGMGQPGDPPGQLPDRRRVGEIALGQDDAVGERHLLCRFGHVVDIAGAGDRVDDGHQRLQMELAAERAVGGKSLQDRPRIGQARGFDDHPRKARHSTPGPVGEQRAQGFLEIGAQIAAQAPVAEQHGRVAARAQQGLVDADLAELVDDDRGVGALGGVEQGADQRGLAGRRESRSPR